MQIVLAIIFESVRSALELALFILLPIMVTMLAVMKVLQAKGVLDFVARGLSPVMKVFGVSGLSVIAALQQLFVSFAAPPTTLAMMVQKKLPPREIAATLAMVMAMSQANATFPLTALGLNLWVTWLTSVVGGLAAAALTYYLLFPGPDEEAPSPSEELEASGPGQGWMRTALDGAREGVQLVLKSLPVILVAVLAVNVLTAVGALKLLESMLTPVMQQIGLSGVAIVPIVTKYLAGGTAMMGVTLDLIREGSFDAPALNRIAGATINPLDPVGLAVLAPAVAKTPNVLRPAVLGALAGIVIRGILHLILF